MSSIATEEKPSSKNACNVEKGLSAQTLVQVLFIVITVCARKTLSENAQVIKVS